MKPILIQWSNFTLYSYPLFLGLAWGIGYRFSEFILLWQKKEVKNLKWFFIGIFLFAWMGAKITFLLASSQDNLIEYGLSSNFWLGGGFVFYGGLIGGALFTFFYSFLFKQFDLKNVYLLLPALCFAHAMGRVGCFLTGCCYGSLCELPFAVHFKGAARHPVQLYEFLGLMLLGFALLYVIKKGLKEDYLLRLYVIGYGSLRFGLEFFRGDMVRGIYAFGLSTSQMISLFLIVFVVLLSLGQRFIRRPLESQRLPR